ncbi:MAG: response regulator transcription factor [Firmicutes bacterium]|nr:response regulator transcription factor [Bacillota bacterium]MDY3092775.1 response regulator transcription factor [Erysipelotrichaceae bacterium]
MDIKILIVDDEEMIRKLIRKYALNEGYTVLEACNGQEAVDIALKEDIRVIVMDVMMPVMDGFKAYQRILEEKNIPCIFLTALNEEYNRIYGFDLGADDYVGKPFSANELMKRIQVILKHQNIVNEDIVGVEGLKIDLKAHMVSVDNQNIALSLKEYDLLVYLFKNRGIALSRESILEHVWGYDYFKDDRTLDTHIKLLRKSLGPYSRYITTIRGVGYRFEKTV